MMPKGGQYLTKMLKINGSLHPQSGLGTLITKNEKQPQ